MARVMLADAMQAVGPGLWWWTAPHPDWSHWDPTTKTGWDWPREAGCVCYEAEDALVLIDPLAPPVDTPEHARFWAALDQEVGRRGRPVAVLLTSDWHDRSAQAVYDRYHGRVGGTIWAPAVSVEKGSSGPLTCRVTHTYQEGGSLPGGAQAYSMAAWYSEVALYLPQPRALFVADSLWSTADSEAYITSDKVRPVFRRILETWPIDVILLSHGRPVLERGHEVLARVLEQPQQPPWGK